MSRETAEIMSSTVAQIIGELSLAATGGAGITAARAGKIAEKLEQARRDAGLQPLTMYHQKGNQDGSF